MNIVQVIPSLTYGGAETFVTRLAEAQRRAGHTVHLVCISKLGPLLDQLSPELRENTHLIGKSSRWDVSALPRLVALFRRLKPDVVHTHLFTGLSWGTAAARLAGVPVVVDTEHACHDDEYAYLPPIRRLLSYGVDAVVGCSEAVSREVRRRHYAPGYKVLTVDNGIPLEGRPRAPMTGLHVGTVGRLVEVKGQKYLVEAMRLVRDRGVEMSCTIVGDGPLEAELRAQVAALGLDGVVTLAGASSEVPAWLARFDLFCLPSLSEGLPMTLLEASAAGLPMLVTSGGGGGILIEAGAGGWVVPPGDAAALADKLCAFAAMSLEDRRALGERSLRLVHERYSVDVCVAAYDRLYWRHLRGADTP